MILVLGNEGAGMRTNIARRCDVLVKIPQKPLQPSTRVVSEEIADSVDSLNVSVTGGIVLHHLLSTAPSSTTATTKG
jgi:21S rRNA (GM2251-2'-O)-methyltransferase